MDQIVPKGFFFTVLSRSINTKNKENFSLIETSAMRRIVSRSNLGLRIVAGNVDQINMLQCLDQAGFFFWGGGANNFRESASTPTVQLISWIPKMSQLRLCKFLFLLDWDLWL